MINVEELMVGNVVSTNGTPCNMNVGGIYKVIATYCEDTLDDMKGIARLKGKDFTVSAWCEFLEPVILTETLLLSLGFTANSHIFYKTLGNYKIVLVDNKYGGFSLFIDDDNNERDTYEKVVLDLNYQIKYVHKLQNLIYMITNLHLNFEF